MKIVCKASDICIKSVNPNFKYRFGKEGIPVEVEESHVKKILMNKDFCKSEEKAKVEKIVEKVSK